MKSRRRTSSSPTSRDSLLRLPASAPARPIKDLPAELIAGPLVRDPHLDSIRVPRETQLLPNREPLPVGPVEDHLSRLAGGQIELRRGGLEERVLHPPGPSRGF